MNLHRLFMYTVHFTGSEVNQAVLEYRRKTGCGPSPFLDTGSTTGYPQRLEACVSTPASDPRSTSLK